VPFIHQPTLGGTHLLRGFAESRFRDRNAVWASAEYQWEAWWALDGAIFVDAGQVAAHRARLSLDRFEVSYGIGFRLHSDDNFMARLDIARSREGIHPILGFRYGF
jgi:outer membrane protein assembly factor BamA